MRLTIDTDKAELTIDREEGATELPLYSREAFEVVSREWVKLGWNRKYPYTFSWMGRPLIQLPEDVLRVQEVIYRLRPDVIVETGIAHGGSLIFYASLCKAMGKGRVIGIDIDIRSHNREAIEAHELHELITMVEGSSTDPDIVAQIAELVGTAETVMVILDSCHTRDHVAAELEAYHHLVTAGSYIVATDGVMKWVHDLPRGEDGWDVDNPASAAVDFVTAHPEFVIEQPEWPFNESDLRTNVTHWPEAWIKRR